MAKQNASGALPRPKVQLSFTLDSSGVSSLSKAEVSVVEEYEVDAILHKVRLCVLRLHLTNLLCRGSSKGTRSTRSGGKTILLRSPTPVLLPP